jgi:putative membrane protein
LMNTCVAICLILAIYFIKKGDFLKHRALILTGMLFSCFFLVSYVLYHFTTPETIYCKIGWSRYVYYFFLITHIVLAGVSLPFILFTFVRGFTFQVDKHKRMARWVFPVWLYVAISGPICYIMLKPCYL